jgi:hypothetical protein
LDSDLFDTFPEIIFGSLKKQMLLGIVPAQTVGIVLRPLLRNFHAVMPGLSPDLREDFENILRIYPDVAARYELRMKPPIVHALNSLVQSLAASAEKSARDDWTGIELDLAAEEQGHFSTMESAPLRDGQGFFTTNRGNTVFLEFSSSPEDDSISFSHKPPEMELDLHICGTYAFTLGPAAPEKRIEKTRLLRIFTPGTPSADIFQLIEKKTQ